MKVFHFFRFQEIKYTIHTRDKDFNIDCRKILKLIDALNPNKSHGCGDISIRMWKLCYLAVTKPVSIIIPKCHTQNVVPDDRKNSKIFIVHKENNKQLVNKYQSVSL